MENKDFFKKLVQYAPVTTVKVRAKLDNCITESCKECEFYNSADADCYRRFLAWMTEEYNKETKGFLCSEEEK